MIRCGRRLQDSGDVCLSFKVHTTAYRQTTNGAIECFHATMHSLLARFFEKLTGTQKDTVRLRSKLITEAQSEPADDVDDPVVVKLFKEGRG